MSRLSSDETIPRQWTASLPVMLVFHSKTSSASHFRFWFIADKFGFVEFEDIRDAEDAVKGKLTEKIILII